VIALSRAVLGVAAFAAAALGAASAHAGAVRSLLEARHQNVVIQEWDSSCGAAALATVLRYQLGDPVTERSVAVGMLRGVAPERVRARGGFSLLDMKRYAQARGFEAEGYAGLTRGQLLRLAPAIVPIRSFGGDHFVVFRGVVNGQAVVADPAFGNRSESFAAFESKWKDRLAFVVQAPGSRGNRLRATPRDLLRAGDEAQRFDEALPRPLGDYQMANVFAADSPATPPSGPLVPIVSPDTQSPRPASPPVITTPASPLAPPTVASVSAPGIAPTATLPTPLPSPTVTIAPSLPSPTVTIAPSLPSPTVTIGTPVSPPIAITLPPVTIPTVTLSPPVLPPLPLPLGR
jgi:uncharacterized protein